MAVIGASLFSACGGKPAGEVKAAGAPVSVGVVEARAVAWPSVYEAAGTVRPRVSAAIASRVMALVREVRVRPGDRVRAGQLLVTLDARDLDASLRQSEAAVVEASSAVAELESTLKGAAAQKELAESTFRRMKELHAKRSISDQEFDEAGATLRVAQAAFETAASRRAQIEARIAGARQAREAAAVMRGYSELRAPFAGVVTEKKADAGAMAVPGSPLLVVEDTGSFRVEAAIDESLAGSVRLRQSLPAVLDGAERTVTATVDEIVPAIDAASRTLLVKAAIQGPGLRSGMFARLLIPRGSSEAIVVPAAAIRTHGDVATVLVAEGGVARSRMVTTGRTGEAGVEILSGLPAGERVIFPRPAGLADGVQVEARR